MPQIHPTAIVDRRAELADDVSIGAYSIIKGAVTLGPGTIVHEHSHIHGHSVLGSNCKIGPGAYVGLPPQHLKFDGENSSLLIGNNVIIRETASVHRAIHPGLENATRVSDRCLIMGGCHVAHDCVVGQDVVMANSALLGGHCHVADRAFIGGGVTLHQFVRVGRLAIIAGNEAISHDVPPFAAVRYRGMKGYNAIGCKRSGMSSETIDAVRSAYHCLHIHRTLPGAVAAIKASVPMLPEIIELLDFLASTHRGVVPSVHARGGFIDPYSANVSRRLEIPEPDGDDNPADVSL
jgi:UDP-N-acetylglucosamine acyltransferase